MLQDDHTLFRSIFEQPSVGMVAADPEQRLVKCNPAFCGMLGYGHEEIIGLRIADVISLRDKERIESELTRSHGEPAAYGDWQFRRKDGSSFAGAVLGCKSPDGCFQAIVLDVTQAKQAEAARSAQARRDGYLLELERQLRNTKTARDAVTTACEAIGRELGAAFAGVGEFQADGKQTVVESAWSASGDLTPLLGRHGDFPARQIAEFLAGGATSVEDTLTDPRIASDEGAQAACKAIGARSAIIVPLIRDGKPCAMLIVGDASPRAWTEAEIALARETLDRVWNAAERARAEEELRLTTGRFELALKGSPVTVFCQDLDLRYTWVQNPPSGISAQVVGKLSSEILERAEDAAAIDAIKREAIRSGKSQRREVAVHAGGAVRFFDLLVDPLCDSSGKIAGVRSATIDITAQKEADAALREAKERHSFLLALSDALRGIEEPAGIMAAASALLGRKLAAGQVAYADVDKAAEHALVSREWNDGTIPSNASLHRIEDFGDFLPDLRGGQTIVVGDVRADPRTSKPEALATFERVCIGAFLNVPLVKSGRLVAVLAVHMRQARAWTQEEVKLAQEVAERTWEAVERARVEQALRESEERLRFSLKGAGAAAWHWDFLAQEQVWSPESYDLHGRDPKLGSPRYEDWLRCVHPGDRERIEHEGNEAIEKKAPEYRTEYRVVLPSGDVRWLASMAKVDYAADGTPLRMSGINLDITDRKRAEQALQESEELLRLSLKGAGAGAWKSDIGTREVVWSPECYRLHGRDPELGEPGYDDWLQCVHPDDRATVEKANLDAIMNGAPEYRTEYRVVLPSGEVRWLEVLGKVDYAEDGRPLRMSGINLDITERKRAEETLRKAEELQREKRQELETLLEAIPAAVFIAEGADCTRITGNRTAHDLLRIPDNISISEPAEFIPKHFELFSEGRPLSPKDLPVPQAAAARKPVLNMEHEIRFAEGGSTFLLGNAFPLFDDAGEVRGAVGAFIDVTALKRTEAALRESEERLRLALKGAGAAAWQWDISTNEQIWSPESYELHGRDPKLGPPSYQDWLQSLHPGDRAGVEKAVLDAVEKKSPEYRTEYRVVLPSGEVRWLDGVGKVAYAADGRPLRMSGINRDITERKRAEDALRKAEELQRQKRQELETILAAIPAAVLIAKDAGCKEFIGNPAAYRLRRVPAQMSLSKSAASELVPKHYEVFSKGRRVLPRDLPMQKAIATKTAIVADELELRFSEGDVRFELGDALPLFDEAGEVCGAVGVFTDITDLKRTEAALRESEARLKFALEAAGAGIGEMVPETGEVFASDRALALLGLPAGIPLSPETALAGLHPKDLPGIHQALRRTLETGEPYRQEARVLLPDGSVRWLEFARGAAIGFRKAGHCRTGSGHHGSKTRRAGVA